LASHNATLASLGGEIPGEQRRGHHDRRRTVNGDKPAFATDLDLDLDAAGVGAVVWATGYQLDFGWVDLPVLDEWGYPRHRRGVTTHPGLYAVGLRWLHSEPSSVLAGVGADAAHIVEHLVERRHMQ
jgi:putative flavoprotein involved in K+ transport